jgi:hypothetical protein
MYLAKRYAPKAVILANGSLHNIDRAVAALDDGADIVTIARGALANPDLPRRLSDRGSLNDFDPTILGPIANNQGSRAGDVTATRLPRLEGVRLNLHITSFADPQLLSPAGPPIGLGAVGSVSASTKYRRLECQLFGVFFRSQNLSSSRI